MNKFIVFSFVGFSVLAHAFESAPSMMLVGSTYSGHEEITRQALNNTSNRIKDLDSSNTLFEIADLKFDLKPEPKGLFGYKAKNMVILGNFATDFPAQASAVSLTDFWNNKRMGDYENPVSQVLHFLRNYPDSLTLDSAYATCMLARKNIKYITGEAIKAWESGDKTRALFLIGHATHTIQDSFSRAHTQRDDDSHNNNLKNICFYGNLMYKKIDLRSREAGKAICYHNSPDSKDAIWNIDNNQYKQALSNWPQQTASQCDKTNSYPETEEQKDSCMNNEARLARVATEKYLFLVFNRISPLNSVSNVTGDFLETLDTNLFDGPVGEALLDQKMPNGIMRCEGLSTQPIVGSEPVQNGIRPQQ